MNKSDKTAKTAKTIEKTIHSSGDEDINQVNANQAYQRQLIAKIFNMYPPYSQEEAIEGVERSRLDASIHVNIQGGLNVYTNNFIENGIRALSITFPTVTGLIGEDSFRMLARKFLRQDAKASFDWAEYGITLPTFIEGQDALETYPFLSEVAELDWVIHYVQRQADKEFEPSTFASLETGDTDLLRFTPAPGLQLLAFWFPVVDLYQLIHDPYLQSEEGILARKALLQKTTKSINNAINMATPRSLLLWRAEYKAQFKYISDAEADVIQQINAQASVNAVINTVGKHNIDLVEWLSKAISNKLIFAVA
jgi:hypothetical protein